MLSVSYSSRHGYDVSSQSDSSQPETEETCPQQENKPGIQKINKTLRPFKEMDITSFEMKTYFKERKRSYSTDKEKSVESSLTEKVHEEGCIKSFIKCIEPFIKYPEAEHKERLERVDYIQKINQQGREELTALQERTTIYHHNYEQKAQKLRTHAQKISEKFSEESKNRSFFPCINLRNALFLSLFFLFKIKFIILAIVFLPYFFVPAAFVFCIGLYFFTKIKSERNVLQHIAFDLKFFNSVGTPEYTKETSEKALLRIKKSLEWLRKHEKHLPKERLAALETELSDFLGKELLPFRKKAYIYDRGRVLLGGAI